MSIRYLLTYSALGATFIGLTVGLFFTLWALANDQQREMRFLTTQGLWHVTRLEAEFAAFGGVLSRALVNRAEGVGAELERAATEREEYQRRLDSVWSRLQALRQGMVYANMQAMIPRFEQRIAAVEAELKDLTAMLARPPLATSAPLLARIEIIAQHLLTLAQEVRYEERRATDQAHEQRMTRYRLAIVTMAAGFICGLLLLLLCLSNLYSLDVVRKRLQQQVVERTRVLSLQAEAQLQTQERLDDEEAKLRLILASIGEGIYGVNLAGECTFCNPAAVALLGYEQERELRGCIMDGLIKGLGHLESCPAQGLTAQVLSQGGYCGEMTFYRRDGEAFPVECRAHPLVRDGEVLGVVVAFADISLRRQRDQEQLQAQKMETIGQLTGGIAHDFNNLLTVIQGNLSLLLDAADLALEEQELVRDALLATEDGSALTKQLLTFACKQPMRRQPVYLEELLAKFIRLVRRTIPENIDIQLRNTLTESSVISVDMPMLENALLNLMVNAQHALLDGGYIIIQLSLAASPGGAAPPRGRGEYICLSVIDNGIGMDRATLARACEPFFTTRSHKGTGLGLSSVYGFVTQSGGSLKMESQLGKGTTVSLYFPRETRDQVVADVAAANLESLPMGQGELVLIVEDRESVRRLAVRSFKQLGYRWREAATPQAAQQLLLAEPVGEIALLFSDVVMPGGMNGIELARWARAQCGPLCVLLTTGFSPEELEIHDLDPERYPVLRKPYDIHQLAFAVRSALERQPELLSA